MAEHLLTELAYSALPLAEPILQGTRDAGFDRCTPFKLKRCRWFYAVRMLPVRRRLERARPLHFWSHACSYSTSATHLRPTKRAIRAR